MSKSTIKRKKTVQLPEGVSSVVISFRKVNRKGKNKKGAKVALPRDAEVAIVTPRKSRSKTTQKSSVPTKKKPAPKPKPAEKPKKDKPVPKPKPAAKPQKEKPVPKLKPAAKPKKEKPTPKPKPAKEKPAAKQKAIKPEKIYRFLFRYFVSKDWKKPSLQAIHFKKGYVYATDAHILAKIRMDYDKSFEGKSIDKSMNFVNVATQNYNSAIPSPSMMERFIPNVKDLRGVTDNEKQKIANITSKIVVDFQKYSYVLSLFEIFAETPVWYKNKNNEGASALLAISKNITAAIMPVTG